ncbi:DNA-binding transcriptional LysR family regulator [Erwinia persicina]|uniref:LysR family transcriptional regulator n=1 Tax=Erwinia persicina TaxID=55211 RepID=UPI00209E8361|nr:LysR family transcriptional regulator [Erwinia persicina]MCP1439673.1 DNA-binding transcriptional LysR family regulator [Erwinia persicina]
MLTKGKELATTSEDLRFFTHVARLTSLTEVARELGLSLPAVSKRLTQLEEKLGVQLVRRTTRRLELTPEGLLYAEGAEPILSQLAQLEEELGGESAMLHGTLHINASFGFGRRYVAPLVSDFAAQHPALTLNLQLSSQPLNFLNAGIDVDIRVGSVPDSRLIARRIAANYRVVCASPDYLARYAVPQHVEDLAQHNCIVLRQHESDAAIWRFSKAGKEHRQKVQGSLTTNDGEVAMRLALDGHGLILRSWWDAREAILAGKLVQVLTSYQLPSADIYAVYAHSRQTPKRIRCFTDYLHERFEALFTDKKK